MPKYYCDYCDTFLTHDSTSVRKSHLKGVRHQNAVKAYYAQFVTQGSDYDNSEMQRYEKMKTDALQFAMAQQPPNLMPPGFPFVPPYMPPPQQYPPPQYGGTDNNPPQTDWNDNRKPRYENRGWEDRQYDQGQNQYAAQPSSSNYHNR